MCNSRSFIALLNWILYKSSVKTVSARVERLASRQTVADVRNDDSYGGLKLLDKSGGLEVTHTGSCFLMLSPQLVGLYGRIKCGLLGVDVTLGWDLRFQKPTPVSLSLSLFLPAICGSDVSAQYCSSIMSACLPP